MAFDRHVVLKHYEKYCLFENYGLEDFGYNDL